MLMRSGSRLTKRVCNNHNVLATVPEEERAKSVKDLGLDVLPLERTLGYGGISNPMNSFSRLQ
ncbi:hypothetical protein HOLleu_25506 [Holothuria leucospilota]|uniref:Uncharacterized protein n=1 Tax=Holothuria leucospilota TaxID=206669 RepID=A0A9Q1BSJ3_HOLLE|nr:hypothetical protein HOLleu_25506 [Holothuria leucospilota]